MAGLIKLVVCDSKDAVAESTAKVVAEAMKVKPNMVLGLATGSTPEGTYAKLAEKHRTGEISFSKVRTFNLDEYWGLDADHEQSYRTFMNTHLFSKVDIPLYNTRVLDGKAWNPMLECEAFEKQIIAAGGVDLWILGIGQNGHIAFNEPGSSVDSRTRMVNLTPSTIAANSDGRFFSDPNDVPRCALTAGIGTIRESRSLVLLATGEGKAEGIAAAVEGEFSTDCPASLLQDHPDVTFIVDQAAASKLANKS